MIADLELYIGVEEVVKVSGAEHRVEPGGHRVDAVEAVERAVSDEASDRLGHVVLGVVAQLVDVDPFALHDLVLARTNLVVERLDAAHNVQVRAAVSARIAMLLTKGDHRAKLAPDARLLEHLTHCGRLNVLAKIRYAHEQIVFILNKLRKYVRI